VDNKGRVRVGILGAGHMAGKIMQTMREVKEISPVAAASRNKERAEAFAERYKLPKAYGSYIDMLKDPDIDMVYIATPPSVHAGQMKMCLNMGKAVFCEKPFTMTGQEAREVLEMACEKNLFAGEAIWTRYMPMFNSIKELKNEPGIGKFVAVTACLGYPVWERERIKDPELGGGALFDVGIYPLTFIDAVAGMGYSSLHTVADISGGVDSASAVIMLYPSGIVAAMLNLVTAPSDRQGVIYGTDGYATVRNINNFESIKIYNKNHKCIREILPPKQISGYEYQLISAAKAIKAGRIECEEMPHSKILEMMHVMEAIHKDIKKLV